MRETLAICDRAYIIKDGRDHPARDARRRSPRTRRSARSTSARTSGSGRRRMAIELKQQLKLTQQLVMTPQLQQAIKLLQLSRARARRRRRSRSSPRTRSSRRPARSRRSCPREIREDAAASTPRRARRARGGRGDRATPSEGDELAELDWRSYADSYPQPGGGGARRTTTAARLEATLTRRPSLADHLEWQLQLSRPAATTSAARRAASSATSTSTATCAPSLEEVARARRRVRGAWSSRRSRKVQSFDPPGVAARDLRECLLLQLDALRHRPPARARARRRPPRPAPEARLPQAGEAARHEPRGGGGGRRT